MMKQIRLNELCEINIGKTPSRKKLEYWGKGHKWISISDMKTKFINDTKEEITELGIKECNMRVISQNTIIMSFKLSIGKVAITGEDMYTNEAIASFPIKSKDLIYTNYLYYVLQTLNLLQNTDRAVMGATLNKAKLNQIKIPITSLPIQKKIAKALDKAQELIDKRKEQIEALDEFIQSVFLDMFGDPVKNPKGWDKKELKDLAKIITGNTPSRKEENNYGNYIEWIKSDNINTPYNFITKAEEYLSVEGYKKGRGIPKKSILMTCIAGSLSCIGNVALTNREVAFNQQINGIIPMNINLYFLYMQFILSKNYIQGASTNSMKGMVSKGTLSKLEFINPPKELQNKFEIIFKRYLEEIDLMQKSLKELENNFKCLMQRAFKGELFNS